MKDKRTIILIALAFLTASPAGYLLWADSRTPAKTAQLATPEPPLAGAPAPRPPVANAPGSPGMQCPGGTPCPEDPPTPSVSLRVRVPACVGAGQEIEYRICVENCSCAAAHHVIVRNPLPSTAKFVRADPPPHVRDPELQWQLGTLKPGACREICLVLVPTGMDDVKNCARVQFEHGQCVTTHITRPALTIRKCGPETAMQYDSLTYRIEVRNVGAAPATEVLLFDVLPDELKHSSGKGRLSWDLGTLAAGECKHVEYQVVAMQPGRFCNKAAVSAKGGLRETAESCVTVAGEAKLELIKTGPEQRFVNRPAVYQITVSNPSGSPASNVWITDPLPAGTAFVSATDNGRFSGNQVQWQIGTLAAGARRTVQLTLQAQAPGEIINRASAVADRGLTAQAEARTVFEGATGLTFEIDKDDPIEVGQVTSYRITVLNQGTAQATGVKIVAMVPDKMELMNPAAKGPTNHKLMGQQVIFDPVATLAPKAEVKFEIFVRAKEEGQVRFEAELSAVELGDLKVRRQQSTLIFKANGVPAPLRIQPPPP